MRQFISLAFAATVLVACEQDQTAVTEALMSVTRRASFDVRLESAFAELQARDKPVLVAVSYHGGAIVTREFGALRRDGIAPEDTLVDLNSVTKTITAIMVCKLVEQHALAFHQKLGSLLPGVPAEKAGITIHQLLTHTAGFREAVGDDDELLSREAFVRRALATPLIARPGKRYHYSNVGYGLLAAIVEARTGARYEDFLRDELLNASGIAPMGYASVYADARSMRSSRGGSIREESWGGHDPGWNLIGNGGLVTTAPTMLRFLQALDEGRLISGELLERARRPHVLEQLGGDSYYGYGLVVQDVDELGLTRRHDGGNDVYSAQWLELVERGDLIFTAGADTDEEGSAFEAMLVMVRHLYGAK